MNNRATIEIKVEINGDVYGRSIEVDVEKLEHYIATTAKNVVCLLRNRNKNEKDMDLSFTDIKLDEL